MSDIDDIISGARGNTRADFSGIGNLPKAYWEGQDQKAKNDLRDAFKGGLPMKGDQVDWPAVTQKFFSVGAVDQGISAAGQSLAQQKMEYGQKLGDAAFPTEQPAQAPIVSPPSASAPRLKEVAAPLNKGGVQGHGQDPQQGGETPKSYLAKQGLQPGYNMEVALAYFKRNGIDPDQTFDPNDPKLAKLQPTMQRLGSLGQVQPPQPGDGQPQQAPPQVAQAPMQPPPQMQPQPDFNQRFSAARPGQGSDPTLGGLVPVGRTAQQQIDGLTKAIGSNMLTPEVAKTYQSRIDAITKALEPTGPMKEAAASGLTLQQHQERQGEQAASQAGATELAKANVKEQQEIKAAGALAGHRLGTLNAISNVISSDPNLNLGFGSETSLKVKMALEKAGFDFGDLSGSQLIQKLNGVLASESSKQFSTRPTQFEFKTFLTNNPGLALDEKGNVRMLGILSQTAKREYELGKLVSKNRDNWDNWDDVVEAYDKKNPIKDPTTGKILSNNSIIAPGTKQGAQPVKQGPSSSPTFGSKADLHAAIASGKLNKGDSFIGGDGVERTVP